MSTVDRALESVDWQLLSEQKKWLLGQKDEHADGLLNLLDALQDAAEADGFPVVWLGEDPKWDKPKGHTSEPTVYGYVKDFGIDTSRKKIDVIVTEESVREWLKNHPNDKKAQVLLDEIVANNIVKEDDEHPDYDDDGNLRAGVDHATGGMPVWDEKQQEFLDAHEATHKARQAYNTEKDMQVNEELARHGFKMPNPFEGDK